MATSYMYTTSQRSTLKTYLVFNWNCTYNLKAKTINCQCQIRPYSAMYSDSSTKWYTGQARLYATPPNGVESTIYSKTSAGNQNVSNGQSFMCSHTITLDNPEVDNYVTYHLQWQTYYTTFPGPTDTLIDERISIKLPKWKSLKLQQNGEEAEIFGVTYNGTAISKIINQNGTTLFSKLEP